MRDSTDNKVKLVWEGTYFSLFSDGTLGCSDGVGYVGEVSKDEVEDLYKELKKLFESGA